MTWIIPFSVAIFGTLILMGVSNQLYTVAVIGGIGMMGAGFLLGLGSKGE